MEQSASTSQYKQAMKFKKLFHGKDKTIFATKTPGAATSMKHLYGSLNENWSTIEKDNKDGANVYLLVNKVEGTKRRSENITGINAVFIDYDAGDWSAKDIDKFLRKFKVKPHCVVETSPGNFQVFWLVKDMPPNQFKPIQQQLAALFGADPKVCDLSRLMRTPGTINHKYDPPFKAHIVYIDENAPRIPWQEFTGMMFDTDDRQARKASTSTITEVPAASKNATGESNKELAERVEHALPLIPADDREVWTTVGMALHSEFGQEGLPMFDSWSQKSPKYDKEELLRQWESFRPDAGIKIGTLFWLAKIHSPRLIADGDNRIEPSNLLELGKLFADNSGNILRHCEDDGLWYAFNNGRWKKSKKEPMRVAKGFLKAVSANADKSKNEKHRNFIVTHQSPSTVREVLRTAESEQNLSVRTNDFDQDANSIGVKLAGVLGAVDRHAIICLNKAKYRLAMPDNMLLQIAGAPFDPNAKCPLWLNFLSEITNGNDELIEFLQLAVGYTLFGHTREQMMFVLIGSGGNGKGVFSRIIHSVLGEYASTMQSNLLKPGAINANNPSPALMKLQGKRIWTCSEVPKGMKLDEALTKQITGGDLLSARNLYGDQTEFLPVGKLWLSVNTMPRVRHDDAGMWRRLVAIPFEAKFVGKSRDNDLEEKLKAELPGILNWAIKGARKYAKKGKLERPKLIKDLTKVLRGDVDTVGNWVGHDCKRGEGLQLQSKHAYESYIQFMRSEKTAILNQKEFKAEMERQEFKHKSSKRFNYFDGLCLKEG